MSATKLLFFVPAFSCEYHKVLASSKEHVRNYSYNHFLYITSMSEPKITPEDQLRIEQTLVKPAAAAWGVKLLKFLKLEKLLKLGNKEG